MALDSKEKRASVLGVGRPWYRTKLPGAIDAPWRLATGNFYAGNAVAAPDVTAPVLSLPTAIATGTTTATGTVSTDEGNGTLYFWATTNATETAADIIANGDSQAVSASGVQNVSFTGLDDGTNHYAHYVQNDQSANESNVVVSDLFTTVSGEIDWVNTEPRQKVPQPTAHAFGMLRAGDAKVSGRGSVSWKRHNEDALLLLAA